jgi:hypothetical protein
MTLKTQVVPPLIITDRRPHHVRGGHLHENRRMEIFSFNVNIAPESDTMGDFPSSRMLPLFLGRIYLRHASLSCYPERIYSRRKKSHKSMPAGSTQSFNMTFSAELILASEN